MKLLLRALFLMLAFGMPKSLLACAVCMGGADSPVASAVNGAVYFLLAVVAAVLASFGGFIFYLNRRANAAIPPHVDLITSQNHDQ